MRYKSFCLLMLMICLALTGCMAAKGCPRKPPATQSCCCTDADQLKMQMECQCVSCVTPKQFLLMKRQDLLCRLENKGVQVIQVGETFRVIIPADDLFNPSSANIKEYYYPVLKNLAAWMSTYQITTVQVAGYSDEQEDPGRSLALTRVQAQSIAKYLWACGIDARLIYGKGFNGCCPVSRNCDAENRRIEINFLIVPPIHSIIY